MKQITITVPDNCELKQDGHTYTIVEKKKNLTYNDVAKELFYNKSGFYITAKGEIHSSDLFSNSTYKDATNCTSQKQAEKLFAINKLMNVAKYLNGDWQPNWDKGNEPKYYIYYSNMYKTLNTDCVVSVQTNNIFFKSKELAEQAIEILGEETITLALCTDY